MNKFEKDFKTELNQIDLTNEEYEEINIKIKDRYKKYKKKQKVLYSFITVITLALLSSGIVYAEEIKTYVEQLVNKIVEKEKQGNDNKKHNVIEMHLSPVEDLNTNVNFQKENKHCNIDEVQGLRNPEKCEIHTKTEIEELFNIKVLSNNNIENDTYIIKNYYEDSEGNLKYIEIDQPNLFKTKLGDNDANKKHNIVVIMRMKIKSKYASNNKNSYNLYSIDGKKSSEEYYIKNLKVTSLIVKEYNDTMSTKLLDEDYCRVYLIYNNIGYIFEIYSNENKNEFDTEIKEFLDSLEIK